MNSDLNKGSDSSIPASNSRLQLIWELLIFQFKLGIDSLRDIILIPVSIVAGIVGLLAGGSEPDKYYRKILVFGRRTEFWINLFGQRDGTGTSDDLIEPFKSKVFEQAEADPRLQKLGAGINRSLDQVNESINKKIDSNKPHQVKKKEAKSEDQAR